MPTNRLGDVESKEGALRETAKADGLIEGDELLSTADLDKLETKAKRTKNTRLLRQVKLARSFKNLGKGKDAE